MFVPCIASVAGVVMCLYAIRKYRESKWHACISSRRLDGKVVIITGANSGIGKETAKELAKRGAIVILACRNNDAACNTVKNIRATTKAGDLIIVDLDLGDLASVKRCAENIIEKFPQIDILINNAGVTYPPHVPMQTNDGFEIHFGINHLGHFLFTELLFDRLKDTTNSRIIIVSSRLHENGEVDLNTIAKCQETTQRKGRNVLYSDSKLCNVLHAQDLSRRLIGTTTGVYVLCPGFVYTNLFRHNLKQYRWISVLAFMPIAFLFMRSAKQGAQCSVHCAVSETLDTVPFGYYRDCQPVPICPKAQDIRLAVQLYNYSLELVKPFR